MENRFPDCWYVSLRHAAYCVVVASVTTFIMTSCSTQIVHWDSVQMRRHVMDYYNDEIMENLIRAKNGLPFVHVDIASLSAVSGAKIDATVARGQTLSNSGTNTSTGATGQTATTTGPTGSVVQTQVTKALAGAAGFRNHGACRARTL
jgi:hypothetical protein